MIDAKKFEAALYLTEMLGLFCYVLIHMFCEKASCLVCLSEFGLNRLKLVYGTFDWKLINSWCIENGYKNCYSTNNYRKKWDVYCIKNTLGQLVILFDLFDPFHSQNFYLTHCPIWYWTNSKNDLFCHQKLYLTHLI